LGKELFHQQALERGTRLIEKASRGSFTDRGERHEPNPERRAANERDSLVRGLKAEEGGISTVEEGTCRPRAREPVGRYRWT